MVPSAMARYTTQTATTSKARSTSVMPPSTVQHTLPKDATRLPTARTSSGRGSTPPKTASQSSGDCAVCFVSTIPTDWTPSRCLSGASAMASNCSSLRNPINPRSLSGMPTRRLFVGKATSRRKSRSGWWIMKSMRIVAWTVSR